MALIRALSGGGGSGKVSIGNNETMPADRHFNCGFAPKTVLVSFRKSSNAVLSCFWDIVDTNTKQTRMYCGPFSNDYVMDEPTIADNPSTDCISAITSDGFTMSTQSANGGKNFFYIAVG